jgi:carbonic anhydrase
MKYPFLTLSLAASLFSAQGWATEPGLQDSQSNMERIQYSVRHVLEDNAKFSAARTATYYEPFSEKQTPLATVVGCSDSRVPPEIVFDQGLGDLFVVRVAGNVVAPSQIGSVEFAAANLGTRLVVVLGHSNCGAVDAALKSLRNAASNASPHLQTIIDGIRPALESLVAAQDQVTLREAVAANVHQSVAHLREKSDVLKELYRSGDIMIVGAKYSIETGEVRFFDA